MIKIDFFFLSKTSFAKMEISSDFLKEMISIENNKADISHLFSFIGATIFIWNSSLLETSSSQIFF